MPKIRSAKLESPTARLKLLLRKKPYWARIGRGVKVGYRRNQGVGTWSVATTDGGRVWTRKFADADDHDKADGQTILNFWQAQERAKQIARGQTAEGAGAPVTVSQALDAYRRELEANGADPSNATRVRRHLSPALAGKCVAILTVADMRGFRDGLTEKGLKPASVNRAMKPLKAALNAAAASDPRIANGTAWRIGLAGLPVGDTARRLVLPDSDVRRIVAAAREINQHFGLLIEMLAVTGARTSQAARLRVSDLQADRERRLLIPPSRKGGRKAAAKKRPHIPVPIPASLVASLQQAAAGREPDDLLLIRADGEAWGSRDLEKPFRAAVVAAGLDGTFTSYCLRHSSIVRQLLRGLPASLVGSLHDTSETEIRKHYGRYIADVADHLARSALLDLAPATVIPIEAGKRRKAE
jgi:integrase